MGRSELLGRLTAAPERVAVAARRMAAADLAAGGPPPGEWSATEVVGHLVSVETAVWQARLDSFDGLDASAEPAWTWTEPGPASEPEASTLEGALGLFSALRAATVARVAGLDDAGWARAGIHATYGRLDIAALLDIAADHDAEHLAGLEARAG